MISIMILQCIHAVINDAIMDGKFKNYTSLPFPAVGQLQQNICVFIAFFHNGIK